MIFMQPKAIQSKTIQQAATQQAAQAIRNHEVVAFPTETVYGLGANAFSAEAVSKIFALKGRPAKNPLIVHIADLEQLALVASHVSDIAKLLIERFWPGPLTLILPKTMQIAANVTAGQSTVGVRMPNHPMAMELIRAAGVPIAAPSANVSGKPSSTSAQQVRANFPDLQYSLDGGPTELGLESTVLTLDPVPTILRPGALSREEIESVIGPVALAHSAPTQASQSVIAPGTAFKHYSPLTPLRLYGQSDYLGSKALLVDSTLRQSLLTAAETAEGRGERVLILTVTELAPYFTDYSVVNLGTAADLATVARNLFFHLHSIDNDEYDVALAHYFPALGLGLAINDRLKRAAQG